MQSNEKLKEIVFQFVDRNDNTEVKPWRQRICSAKNKSSNI